MTRTVRIGLVTVGLLAGVGLSCGGDSGGTGPSASSLLGTWQATKVELRSLADTTARIDGLANGATLTLWMYEDHTWESVQTDPVDPDIHSAGTWSLSGRTLTITEGGESENFRVSCDGSIMKLTATTTWDYDLDGTEEQARMTMEFLK